MRCQRRSHHRNPCVRVCDLRVCRCVFACARACTVRARVCVRGPASCWLHAHSLILFGAYAKPEPRGWGVLCVSLSALPEVITAE